MDEIPEVINYTRVDRSGNVIIRYADRTFMEDDFYWADSGFFEIFSFPLLKGDPSRALAEPRSMVVSESTARKYFGEEDPMVKPWKYFPTQRITPLQVSWRTYRITARCILIWWLISRAITGQIICNGQAIICILIYLRRMILLQKIFRRK